MSARWPATTGRCPISRTTAPPRDKSAKLSRKWCRKIERASVDQGLSVDVERTGEVRVIEGAIAAQKEFSRDLTPALSIDRVAASLFRLAMTLATPGRSGRPPGSGTHDRDQLNDLIQDVLMRDDGSIPGRQRAIAATVANEPDHQRPALKQRLRRDLPPISKAKPVARN
jgi:hypothetical protein